MVTKQNVLDVLNSIKTSENEQTVNNYILKVLQMEDEKWEKFANEKSLKTTEDIQKVIEKMMTKKTDNKFIPLNEFVSYGKNQNTIHIHLIPKDISSMMNLKGLKTAEVYLIDALEKIQDLMQKDEFSSIENVYAVSGIIRRPISKIFENLDFDIKTMKSEEAKEDQELKKFYEIFKESKYIGRAVMTKEKLLSQEWNQLKQSRKNELLPQKEDPDLDEKD